MSNEKKYIRQLHSDMEHVLNDTKYFLKDLKGQTHVRKMLKKDTRHLKEHLQRLINHLNELEEKHGV